MKKRMMIAGVLAATGGAGSAALAADVYDDSGSWYVDGMGQYTVLDDRRVSKDDFGYQIGIGKNFVPYFAAELNASIGSFNISHSGADQKLNAYSLDFLYKPLPQYIIQPYVLVGGGEMDDSVGGHTTPYHSGLAEAGLGVLAGLGSQTGSTRLQFRVEGKYRIEFISSNEYGPQQPGDVLLSAGLQLSWGNPTPPPPVVAAPPPPPPPPPPDGDDDMDGVPNSIDRCPNTPKGDKVDAYGCTIKDEIKLEGVNFATDSADLIPESDYVLTYAVKTLKAHPELVIEVDGHTDSRGSAKHNLILSQHRAESVLRYLQEHGVVNTLTAKGFGATRPIADNATKEGQLENRRVTLRIIGGK